MLLLSGQTQLGILLLRGAECFFAPEGPRATGPRSARPGLVVVQLRCARQRVAGEFAAEDHSWARAMRGRRSDDPAPTAAAAVHRGLLSRTGDSSAETILRVIWHQAPDYYRGGFRIFSLLRRALDETRLTAMSRRLLCALDGNTLAEEKLP